MKMDSKSPAAFPREPSCTYPPGRCSFTCSARLRARTERAWHAGSARKAEPRSWSDEAGARTQLEECVASPLEPVSFLRARAA